jgi:hypothetical protein
MCILIFKVLFLLVFIQQLTLIILLFYWDPSKSNDFKYYYIDYIFFVCYAICDNLWMTHNLSMFNLIFDFFIFSLNLNLFLGYLLTKSHQLDKSPCVILVYAYSIFSLGSFTGYVGSTYFCFTIKLYITLVFLIIFSFIYIFSELITYVKGREK